MNKYAWGIVKFGFVTLNSHLNGAKKQCQFTCKQTQMKLISSTSVWVMKVRFAQTLALHLYPMQYPIQLDNEITDNLHWCLVASP